MINTKEQISNKLQAIESRQRNIELMMNNQNKDFKEMIDLLNSQDSILETPNKKQNLDKPFQVFTDEVTTESPHININSPMISSEDNQEETKSYSRDSTDNSDSRMKDLAPLGLDLNEWEEIDMNEYYNTKDKMSLVIYEENKEPRYFKRKQKFPIRMKLGLNNLIEIDKHGGISIFNELTMYKPRFFKSEFDTLRKAMKIVEEMK